jgi:hypothetical protein
MGSNKHPTWRCDSCAFWARGDQRSEKRHPDDRTATCRRNPPRTTAGDFEYELLMKLLVIIAWTHSNDEQQKDVIFRQKTEFDGREAWPSTTGSDWCGEWRKDDRPAQEL